MLLSMTGFGESQSQRDRLAVSVEVRCINNRYFKLMTRSTEGYGPLDPRIELLVRDRIRRGSIQVNVRVERVASADDYRLSEEVLEGYRRQLQAIQEAWGSRQPIDPLQLLMLPGVVHETAPAVEHIEEDWPLIEAALKRALDGLEAMRREEGTAMAADLAANLQVIRSALESVEQRAPQVVEAYRNRLNQRVGKILAELNATLEPADVLKEVGLFADRCDISEEIVRLRSHLDQFSQIMAAPESSGRKLEFLVQEMVREGNTIGSKANDVEIARHVIEVKAALERIREMIQNIE
ncbi:MAG: YicC family protein [Pirellulales bacterium]|nr:YicC family protein [Pirellulales bacterium]MDI9443423.1 YicC/YloC family endoribonuclease [Planctomycetota bacterium]